MTPLPPPANCCTSSFHFPFRYKFFMQLLTTALMKSSAVYDALLRELGQEVGSAPQWVTADSNCKTWLQPWAGPADGNIQDLHLWGHQWANASLDQTKYTLSTKMVTKKLVFLVYLDVCLVWFGEDQLEWIRLPLPCGNIDRLEEVSVDRGIAILGWVAASFLCTWKYVTFELSPSITGTNYWSE